MKEKYRAWIILGDAVLVAVMVIADQVVKYLAEVYIDPGSTVPLVKQVIDLACTRNTGAAFRLFSASYWFRVRLRSICGGAIIFLIARYYNQLHPLFHLSQS